MIDTKKIPHLQPQTPQPEKEEDFPEETLREQISNLFSTKKGFALICFIALLIYTSVCFQGERVLRNGIYAALEQLGEDGFGISYEAPSSYLALKSGVNLDDLVISAPAKLGNWVFKASRISITSSPFSPHHVEIKLNGTHSLTTKTIGEIRLIVGKGEINVHQQTKSAPFSMEVLFNNIQTASPKSMEGFFLSHLSFKATETLKEDAKTPVLKFNSVLENMHLPAYLSLHLPKNLEYANISGEASIIDGQATTSPLTQWVNKGGTAEITQAEIIWQPFMTRFSGTFGLNNSFDLTSALVAKVYGFFDLLDMFEKGQYIRSSQVSMAKIVLGKELKKEAGENQPSLETSFSFQSGKIYAGSVLLYDKEDK